MITSASSRSSTLSYPWARSWPSTSSLSSTFIWQPKVSRYSLRRIVKRNYWPPRADNVSRPQFMVPTAPSSNEDRPPDDNRPLKRSGPADALLPDRVPVAQHLDPAAALAFRTPLHEHVLSADGKAAGVITLLGMMFTVLARFAAQLSDLVKPGPLRYFVSGLILAFAASALLAVIQSFRTISPRFP